MKRRIIFHSFLWKLSDVIDNLETIAEQGFNTILVSPVQPFKERLIPKPLELGGGYSNWFAVYQPIDFRIGNELGSDLTLKLLCEKSKEYNIDILVDVVAHHLANTWGNDIYASVPNYLRRFYKTSFQNIQNYEDEYEVTHYSLNGLPALDLTNEVIQENIFKMLEKLLELGVTGFRFDAFKHFDKDFRTLLYNWLSLKKVDFWFGEVIKCSNELMSHYRGILGTDNMIDHRDEDKVIWCFSHDDHLEFKLQMKEQQLKDEYKYMAYVYSAHILYYPKPFDEIWKSNEIREANLGGRRSE